MEFADMIINHGNEEEKEEEVIDDPPEPREPIICCFCSQSIPVNEQVFDCDFCPHSTCVHCRFKENFQCTLCKPSNETLTSVAQSEAASLKELYSIYFKRKKVNKEHIVDVEPEYTEDGIVEKQRCNHCEREFKKSNAPYHYTCGSGRRPHKCTECDKEFVKKSHLQSHLNNHFGFRPFKCSESNCSASFMQKDKLIRHMKSHNKETTFTCTVCNKLYTSQDILNHHMAKVHSSVKQFKCDVCPRSYKYNSSLRIHMLKHLAERDYMCEVCGKKYPLSAQLKLHKRSHMLYQKRPFKCRCGRRFMSRRDKTRHQLTHTSCHDFECSLCNTTFGRKDNLERHMKNFHQEDPRALTKNGKLVATVASFISKPMDVKKVDMKATILGKKNIIKAQTINVENQKALKKNKPKVKQNDKKKVTSNKLKLLKSAKKCNETLNQSDIKSASKTTEDATSKINDEEPIQKQSVIVSPHHSIPQNRPSVIKSIPDLLPYRVLPPDKRFLKMSGETSKGNNYSQTYTSTSQNQRIPFPIHQNHELSTDGTFRMVETPLAPQNVRRWIPKDDALNRCFRIIHHTGATRIEHCRAENIPGESIKTIGDNLKAAVRPLDGKTNSFRSRKLPSRTFSSGTLTSPEYLSYKLNHEAKQNPTTNLIHSISPAEMTNNTPDLNVGGPSLPASFSDSVSEINHEDNFTSSYPPIAESTYSSYNPYFDNEYFRDSMNSYDSNVENLLPNDLDIGFQYINEQLGCSETFSSESRIIKYVSQETRIVRETSD